MEVKHREMRCQWVIWLLVLGLSHVYGNNPCDPGAATACYTDLVHYESLSFPLFGHNEAKLEDTCGNINLSFDCIIEYFKTCNGTAECDEQCIDLNQDINGFVHNNGLERLAKQLCDDLSPYRQVYLENALCLEDIGDLYASCHNDSQASQHYLNTVPEADTIEARCCFFSWYEHCFTDVTRANCGENATFFVSFAIHELTGDILQQLCEDVPSSCTRPPLPDENEIDDHSTASMTTTYSIHLIALSFLYMLLYKYVL